MIKTLGIGAFAAASLALVAPAAVAQEAPPMVSAKDPQGLLAALNNAGYSVELGTDSYGDPRITVANGGGEIVVLFYGCDSETNDDCQSIQFLTGYDRAEPIPAELALSISQKHRFAAVQIDDEGDPFIAWDVYMGDGIPLPVFLAALRAYQRSLVDAEAIIFAEE